MVTEDKDTFDIIVNMQEKVVQADALTPDGEISFDQVVVLASEGGGLPSGPYIEYEVFFENGLGRPGPTATNGHNAAAELWMVVCWCGIGSRF